MKGGDLKCECGAGPVDVADVEIPEHMAIMWHCANGHELITGWRPTSGEHEQMCFAARSAPSPSNSSPIAGAGHAPSAHPIDSTKGAK